VAKPYFESDHFIGGGPDRLMWRGGLLIGEFFVSHVLQCAVYRFRLAFGSMRFFTNHQP